MERIASLQELETWYSITDVADRNDALDAWAEAKREAEEAARSKKG